MKKIAIMFAVAAMALSCNGGKNVSSRSKVSMGDLDDYFTVESCSIESDAATKGIDRMNSVTGTITLVLKKNNVPMNHKPGDLDYAMIRCGIPGSNNVVFMGQADAQVKDLLRANNGDQITLKFPVNGFDPVDPYSSMSESEKQDLRKAHFEGMTNPDRLESIDIEVSFKEPDDDSYDRSDADSDSDSDSDSDWALF